MPKKTRVSMAHLNSLLRTRREQSPDIAPACLVGCRLPQILRADERVYASNWTITYLTGCVACNAVVEDIAHELQREYRLE